MADRKAILAGDTGTDGGNVEAATPSRVFILGANPALEGDPYVVPGNPPRTGVLSPARDPKVFVNGRAMMFEGDYTGTGGTLLSRSPGRVYE